MPAIKDEDLADELEWARNYSFCYRLAREQGELDLLASEIYLLEQWSDVPHNQTREQYHRIMNQWIDLGCSGRHAYHMSALKRTYTPPTDSQRETIILPWRTPQEREAALILTENTARVWLRAHYGQGENALSLLREEQISSTTGHNESDILVLNDENLYNFGDDWYQLLTRIPEVLDSFSGPKDPGLRRKALQVFESDAIESDYGEGLEYFSIEHASITGCLWIQDKESADTGKVLLMWIDDQGLVIRYNRLTAAETGSIGGIKDATEREIEMGIWDQAQYGENYGWE